MFFATLQTVLFAVNSFVDSFMVGRVFSTGQTVGGIAITSSQALELNGMALASIGYISQWFVLFSSAASLFVAAIGFFTAQYFGSGQNTVVKKTIAFKMQIALLIMVPISLAIIIVPQNMSNVFSHLGEHKGVIFLPNGSISPDYANVIAADYGRIAAISYFLWCWNVVTSSSQRDFGDPRGGTLAVILAVLAHVSLNAGLIYGAGFGVQSAAYALLASRFINQLGLSFYSFWKKLPSGVSIFLMFKCDKAIFFDVFRRWQYPLFGVVWSIAIVMRNFWWYQYFPGDAVNRIPSAATVLGIAGAIQSIFLVATDGVGPIIAQFVGHSLGRGDHQTARKYAKWAMSYGIMVSCVISILLIPVAFSVPELTAIFKVNDYNLDSSKFCVLAVAFVYPAWFVLGLMKTIMATGGKSGLISFVDCLLGWIHAPFIILLGYINRKTGVFNQFALPFFIFFLGDFLKIPFYFWVYKKSLWWQTIARKETGSF